METGSPIVAGDGRPRYVRSIVKLVNRDGNVVGWVYLADDDHHNRAQYVQANRSMSVADRLVLELRANGDASQSNVALLKNALPTDLRAQACTDAPSSR